MIIPHPGSPGSVRLAPTWHQTRSATPFRSTHQNGLFTSQTPTPKSDPTPLIVDQHGHSNPLFCQIVSRVVPTWCQA